MIDCSQIITQLSDYLDGEVSPETKQIVEKHLAKCHRCSLVYSTTRHTLKIVTQSRAFVLPAAVGTRLHARLRDLFAAS